MEWDGCNIEQVAYNILQYVVLYRLYL